MTVDKIRVQKDQNREQIAKPRHIKRTSLKADPEQQSGSSQKNEARLSYNPNTQKYWLLCESVCEKTKHKNQNAMIRKSHKLTFSK